LSLPCVLKLTHRMIGRGRRAAQLVPVESWYEAFLPNHPFIVFGPKSFRDIAAPNFVSCTSARHCGVFDLQRGADLPLRTVEARGGQLKSRTPPKSSELRRTLSSFRSLGGFDGGKDSSVAGFGSPLFNVNYM